MKKYTKKFKEEVYSRSKRNIKLKINISFPVEIEEISTDRGYECNLNYNQRIINKLIEKQVIDQLQSITKNKNLEPKGSDSLIGFLNGVRDSSI